MAVRPVRAAERGIGSHRHRRRGSSVTFAMNIPGTVYSCPLRSEKCICQRSSRPGDECNDLHHLRLAAFARAVVHDRHAGVKGVDQHLRSSRYRLSVMQSRRAHPPCRCGCSGTSARIPCSWSDRPDDRAEFSERHDRFRPTADPQRCSSPGLKLAQYGFGLPAPPGQRRLDRLARRGHDAHVEAGDGNLVAGFATVCLAFA